MSTANHPTLNTTTTTTPFPIPIPPKITKPTTGHPPPRAPDRADAGALDARLLHHRLRPERVHPRLGLHARAAGRGVGGRWCVGIYLWEGGCGLVGSVWRRFHAPAFDQTSLPADQYITKTNRGDVLRHPLGHVPLQPGAHHGHPGGRYGARCATFTQFMYI